MEGKKHRKSRRKHKNREGAVLVLGAVLVILLIAAAVVIILKISSGGKSRETGNVTESVSESSEAGEDTESIPESEESRETELGNPESLPEEAQTAVAAEVGSMEDEGDPQKSSNASGQGNGASVSITTDTLKPTEGETAEMTLGIDVSKYQGGNIDWSAVKAAGIDFAIVRVGYRTKATGIIYEDPAARYNIQEAQKNGIKVGA